MPQVIIEVTGLKESVEQALVKLHIHHNLQDLNIIQESPLLPTQKDTLFKYYLTVEFEAAKNA
jgi:hypothetical protein